MSKLDQLKPIVRKKAEDLVNACALKGIPIIVTSTYRSFAEQNRLYAQGRTTPGAIVTKAKGGESYHNYGIAFDICPLDKYGNPDWSGPFGIVGKIGESIGLEWGGEWRDFPDIGHFQYTEGYSLADFQKGRVDWSKFEIPNDPPPQPPDSLSEVPHPNTLTPEETNYFMAFIQWISRQIAKLSPTNR